jgi:hypothetical protein
MWESGHDEESQSTGDDDDDAGLGKKELVDGLVAAVSLVPLLSRSADNSAPGGTQNLPPSD